MGENMMCSAHKSANEKSRAGWDRTFGKSAQEELDELSEELSANMGKLAEATTDAVEILKKRYDKETLNKFIDHSKGLGW